MWSTRLAALALALAAAGPARAGVVINEILYHAPDDLDNVQFVELHNPDGRPADLSGWKLAKGVAYTFPAGTRLDAGGYLVVCKSLKEFKTYYRLDAAGAFAGSLDHGNGAVELLDAAGKRVDLVKYKTRAPWPVAADGHSSSLERICPTAASSGPENWAPSPLAPGSPRPAGTPGKKNASYAPRLPVIGAVTCTPAHAAPGQEVTVEAAVRGDDLAAVELRYRVAGSGFEKAEQTVPMTKTAKGTYQAKVPPQKAKQIVRVRVRAADKQGAERFAPHPHELRPAYSVFVHEPYQPGAIPLGFIINVGAADFPGAAGGFRGLGALSPNPPARGNSAFVHVDAKTGVPTLFDFVSITPRSGGHRVRFHKDHTLGDLRTVVLIHEEFDRGVLAEPLAYELYRRAGNAACRTDFVRTWVDDRPLGFQLQIEVVNKGFLKHHHVRTDGYLYKVNWFGGNTLQKHEKKTYPRDGHDDLFQTIDLLAKSRGDGQWEVIKKHFDAEQFINYFAVNMLLSHWDGFFNNHFTYHDARGTGKWTIYPWDQDKTWGYHDGLSSYQTFHDMPLTLGMAGDAPKGWPKGVPPPELYDYRYSRWWRPGGVFAKPLLANPHFRKLFLARTKELLETVYTEDFFPAIDALGDRLKDEVKVRAGLRGEDPRQAQEHLHRNLGALKEHLTKRRQFLLDQDEIKQAGRYDRSLLAARADDGGPVVSAPGR